MSDAGEPAPEAARPEFLDGLPEAPWKFGFYGLLRRLECHAWRTSGQRAPRLGESRKFSDDPVRLTQDPTLGFPATAVSSFEPGGPVGVGRLGVFFFGMFGPQGALPLHWTEHVLERAGQSDFGFRAFVDIFHHRSMSLYYRAWASAQPAVHYDRPETDRYASYFGATIGIGTPALQDRVADLPDRALLHFAGLFSNAVPSAERLESVLASVFGVDARVEPFVGRWLPLPEESITRLGESPMTGTLGQTAIAGTEVWDVQHNCRVVLGPMSFDEFERFLPDVGEPYQLSARLRRLGAIVRFALGDELRWDIKLVLAPPVPTAILGTQGLLGWTAFTAGEPQGYPFVVLDLQDGLWREHRAMTGRRRDHEKRRQTNDG